MLMMLASPLVPGAVSTVRLGAENPGPTVMPEKGPLNTTPPKEALGMDTCKTCSELQPALLHGDGIACLIVLRAVCTIILPNCQFLL